MTEGIIENPKDIMLIAKYIKGTSHIPQPFPYKCPEHGEGVHIKIEGKNLDTEKGKENWSMKARLSGCCPRAIDEKLEEISKTIAWVEYLKSKNQSAE